MNQNLSNERNVMFQENQELKQQKMNLENELQ